MDSPGAEHGAVAMRIAVLLLRHVEDADLGIVFGSAVGFQLASQPDNVRAPDVAFIARGRRHGHPERLWPGPPDLAIEVVAPNDPHSQVEGMALDWLAAGTHAVLVVDPPRRTATVYRARDDIRVLGPDERLEIGDVVPGWSPLVGAFFL